MPTPPVRPAGAAAWAEAVVYEVYVRSFGDSDGDGLGDLAGVTARLDHLVDLGVDALWLTPFYVSPMADGGYDVAGPRDVDPRFGDLAAFDALVAAAHARGLRVMVDVVPNHTSDRRDWFVAALAAGRGSPERARYWFRDGRGDEPPNNWRSVFGGSAWTRVPDGQWYLHLFAPQQPDLDWTNPEVLADLERTLRFWAARGVEGFRIDVAHGLAKPADLPDMDLAVVDERLDGGPGDPRFDEPAVHGIWRAVRPVLDELGVTAVGEVWVPSEHVADYARPDELPQVFDFRLLLAAWDAVEMRAAVTAGLALPGRAWAVENHDSDRLEAHYGGGPRGAARARAVALLLCLLPGSVYLYEGQELGLPEVVLPDDALRDPIWERSGHTQRGRDGCRVPIPWSGTAAPYGFSPAGVAPWLPMPADWAERTAAAQAGDEGSVLAL